MTPHDSATPVSEAGPLAPTESHAPPPRPRGPISLVVLAVLAVGYTLWASQALILPVLLAMFFALVGNPIIRMLQRLWLPRFVAALLVVVGGLAGAAALGNQLVEPAGEFVRQMPQQVRQIAPKLRDLTRPVQEANRAAQNIARVAGGQQNQRVQVVSAPSDPYRWLLTTPKVVASVLAVILLTFFFMVYGAHLQRHALQLLPSRQQQKLTVEILQSIEREISRYVLTISVINALLGMAFALALYLLDVPLQEALLWGTMVALLNFAPYVGPLIGILAMLGMGLLAYDELWRALLPATIYLVLHTLEGQIITPIVLGRRMALSPLVLILALMVFGWLWGIIGLLLAVPLLVCVKLVLARLDGMGGWARLLE